MPLPEIVIYSKPSCCLCKELKAQLLKLNENYRFTWREVNILDDKASYDMFKNEIPVVFVNGRKAFKYRLDEARLIRLLKKAGGEETGRHVSPDPMNAPKP